MGNISDPTPLVATHNVRDFRSGSPSLDSWLRSKSKVNQQKGGSRTYVVCHNDQVIGFYSLAATSVEPLRVSRKVGRNMPNPIPMTLLGQLATDERFRGIGLGADLLLDACVRALTAADTIGARGIMVQAVDEAAKAFYEKYDFKEFSALEPLMLLLPFSVFRKTTS